MSDSFSERTIFNIPAENLAAFEKACIKLSKKAVKMGCEEIKPFVFGYQTKKLSDGLEHRIYEVYLTATAPKINGWTFVARLDHSNDTGNIVRMVPNTLSSLPERFRNCKPDCDHCKVIRKRRDTFVLHCEDTNEFKLVGSSCLLDFFGHDPIKLARMAELLGYANEAGRGAEEFIAGLNDLRWVHVETFCENAATSIRLNGWVSGKAAYEDPALTSTREVAMGYYCSRNTYTNDEDRTLAADAIAWAVSLRDKNVLTDYEHNILVIAEAEMIEIRSCGLAASIVGMFLRNRQRELERAAKNAAMKDSDYIGSVGDKIKNLEVTLVACNSFANAWGTTYLYKMITTDGNVLTWFSSKSMNVVEGAKLRLLGTVKKHDSSMYGKQTVVTRCKFEAV